MSRPGRSRSRPGRSRGRAGQSRSRRERTAGREGQEGCYDGRVMAASRKDRRAQERREAKVARRALPIVQDTPFRAPIRTRYAMKLADGAQPRDVLADAQREADAFGARTFAAGTAPA